MMPHKPSSWEVVKCVICGKEFKAPKCDERKSCSRACQSKAMNSNFRYKQPEQVKEIYKSIGREDWIIRGC